MVDVDGEGREQALQARLAVLDEQLRRQQMILDAIDVGTWEWNPQTGAVHVSARWAAIVGYSLEELQPVCVETFVRLVHPEDLARSDAAVAAHFEGATEAYECLMRMRHRDGHWVWVHDRGKVQCRDDQGRPLWMYGAHADISEQQQLRHEAASARQSLQSIVDASDEVAMIATDTQGVITLFNSGAERLLGYSAGDVIGNACLDQFHDPCEVRAFIDTLPADPADPADPAYVPRAQELFAVVAKLARQHTYSRQWTFVRSDGRQRQVRLSISAITGTEGEVTGFIGMATDLTALLQVRAEARLAEEKFAGAFTSAALGMALVSLEGRWLDVNDSLCRILGYGRTELLQVDFQRLTHPDDLAGDLDMVRSLLAGERPHYHLVKRYRHRNGGTVWARIAVSLVRSESGEPVHFVSQIQDITEQRASEQRLQESEQRSRVTLDAVADMVLTLTPDGVIAYANAAAARTLGDGRVDGLVGRAVAEVVQLTTEYAPQSLIDPAVLLDPDSNAVDLHADLLLRVGGELTAVDMTKAWLHEDDDRLRGAVWVLRDDTQQRARQREARQLAELDPLTDLVNRRGFEAHLRRAIENVDRTGQAASLMFIDLDRFKPVNDTWGHLAGDAMLWAISSLLRQGVRDVDVVARLGGDEFAVILAGCSLRRAGRIGNDLLAGIRTLALPWEQQQIRVGASIGIAAITSGMRVEEAVAAADAQCYRAKAAGRNNVQSEAVAGLQEEAD